MAEAAEALKDAWLNNAAFDAPQLLVKDVACYCGWEIEIRHIAPDDIR